MNKVIRAEDNLSAGEIEKIINESEEFDIIGFTGVFRFKGPDKRFFMLGKESVHSYFMITKPNLRLDFSNAKIFLNIGEVTCRMAFLCLYQTARNTRIYGLDVRIDYDGEKSRQALYGIYNCSHTLSVERSHIEIYASAQINAVGIFNNGGIDTPLDTQADNLSVINSKICVKICPEEYELPCEAFGIRNYYANSIQLADNYMEVRIKGAGKDCRATGVYNNGRFCRFSNNNIKANGCHNKGVSLEEASAFGMTDEGFYSLISNCNIVGEWGGKSIGLLLMGEFTKVNGCKILSTHTINGTTVRIEGNKVILSNNILTSTSRNARVIYSKGDVITVSGNIIEVLMNPDDCVTGVGAYIKDAKYALFSDNQIRTIKDCGLYLKNSTVIKKDNLYLTDGLSSAYKTEAENDTALETLFDEAAICSVMPKD